MSDDYNPFSPDDMKARFQEIMKRRHEETGDWYYDSPTFGKLGPYKSEADARDAAEKELGLIQWIAEHELAIFGAIMFGGLTYMVAKNPEKTHHILNSVTTMISETTKGVGEIVKGVGEVVPG